MYNSKDYQFEFYIKGLLVVIALMFITSCCESCSDTNEYNDGKCPYCGGTFVYDTAVVRIDIDEYYDFDGRGCIDTFKVAIY